MPVMPRNFVDMMDNATPSLLKLRRDKGALPTYPQSQQPQQPFKSGGKKKVESRK